MTPYQKQRRKVDYYRRERRMAKSVVLRKAHVRAMVDLKGGPGTYAAWSGTVVSAPPMSLECIENITPA